MKISILNLISLRIRNKKGALYSSGNFLIGFVQTQRKYGSSGTVTYCPIWWLKWIFLTHTQKASDKICQNVFVYLYHKSISHHLPMLRSRQNAILNLALIWIWTMNFCTKINDCGHFILINIFAPKKFAFNNSLVLDIKINWNSQTIKLMIGFW